MHAIEIENLYKSYDGLQVLSGLNLRVQEGQVYGLLGPNGVGKSTLIHLLLGFLKPTRGVLRVFGQQDLEQVRGRIGYLPERLRYHLRYSGREYLRYLGQFSDLHGPHLSARVEQELAAVGLLDAADRRLATYSKGMLQRLGIAQALLSDPDILLIDEPTSGLDPAGQREMLDLLAEVRGRNHTIFLTTHFLDEIELLCDTVGILFGGKLAAEIDVQSLHAPGRSVLIKVAHISPELTQQLQRFSPAVRCTGREINLQPNTAALQAQVLRALLDANVPIIALEPLGRPLEDIYMRIVRGEIADLPAAEPPPGMFAPPGHPDAATGMLESADPTPAGRPGSGDTLLRELLRHERDEPKANPTAQQEPPASSEG
jgi:ABC-2 type transport system ATP-binding protein